MSVKDLDVHPRYISSLLHARIKDVRGLLCLSKLEIVKKTGLSENAVKGIFSAAAKFVCAVPPTTVWDILNGTSDPVYQHLKLPTYCKLLDSQLDGGIVYPGITEICGESGSGKTQLAIHLCLTAQLESIRHNDPAGALYISTEDAFPTKRLYQMAQYFNKQHATASACPSNLTDRIYIEHCGDLEDLWSLLDVRLNALLSKVKVKLIVIDSIAALFRTEYDLSEMHERAIMLAKFGRLLHDISFKKNLCVVCINQVSDVFDEKRTALNANDGCRSVAPALGLTWSYYVNTRLMIGRTQWKTSMFPSNKFNKQEGGPLPYDIVIRSLRLIFAPHLPPFKSYFLVHEEGIKDYRFPASTTTTTTTKALTATVTTKY